MPSTILLSVETEVFFHVAPDASSPSLVNLIEHEIALARRKRRVLKRALEAFFLYRSPPRVTVPLLPVPSPLFASLSRSCSESVSKRV